VSDRDWGRVGLAIVRVVVDDDGFPVIRILSMDDVFGKEHDIAVTRSPDDAAAAVRAWLESVLGPGGSAGTPRDGDGTVTPP